MRLKRSAAFLLFLCLAFLPGGWGLSGEVLERGLASWYGGKFQGRRTASGEIFDTYQFTAAHKTLPFGVLVKVTNLENRKVVTVRINDRGPFVEGRIIDLSYAAAGALEMVNRGVAPVQLELVPQPGGPSNPGAALPAPGTVIIQVGSFRVQNNAEALLERLRRAGLAAELEEAGGAFRVILPRIPSSRTQAYLDRLRQLGYPSPLVRRRESDNP
jgi:rare lipoprotein A